MRNGDKIPLSLANSISRIMVFFDFEKMAEIEEKFFERKVENEDDSLTDEIKEFALSNLWECAEECLKRKADYWIETKYNFRLECFYDEKEPTIALRYVPIQWD